MKPGWITTEESLSQPWVTHLCMLWEFKQFFFSLLTTVHSATQVYLSRIISPAHGVFGALVIRSSPVEMELLEPVCARDWSIGQSCKKKHKHWARLMPQSRSISPRRSKSDGSDTINCTLTWWATTSLAFFTEVLRVPAVLQDRLRWRITINVQVLLTSTLQCYVMHLFAVCQVFETVADNPTYCSIPTHTAFPKQGLSGSLCVHSLH